MKFFALFLLFVVSASCSQLKDFATSHLTLNHIIYSEVAKCASYRPFVINSIIAGTRDSCGLVKSGTEHYYVMPFMNLFTDGTELPAVFKLLGIAQFYSFDKNIIHFNMSKPLMHYNLNLNFSFQLNSENEVLKTYSNALGVSQRKTNHVVNSAQSANNQRSG